MVDDMPGATLGTVLSRHARRASDRRLAIDIALGATAALAILMLRPDLWLLVLPFVTLLAFGIWGVADRSRSERHRSWLVTTKNAAALLGFGAALLFGLGVLAVVTGNWLH